MAEPDPTASRPEEKIIPTDVLPEVQPPSAGFILQLFIIPGIIVFVIIMVWLLFTWLAHMGGDPRTYLDAIKQNRPNSWQQAYNLSEALRQSDEYKNDAELSKEIALFLDKLLETPLPEADPDRKKHQRDARSEETARRGFLCKTLGEFYVADDSLPVLIKAAGSHTDEQDIKVRLAALESIALLAENVKDRKSLENPKLMPLLLAASENEDHKIALRGAVALSAIGNEKALARLEEMITQQQHVDVLYNVATGLARHGRASSQDVLLEMLDPDEDRGINTETDEQARGYKRAVILLNALEATRQLVDANPKMDVQPLLRAVERLQQADVPRQIQLEAATTQRMLSERTA